MQVSDKRNKMKKLKFTFVIVFFSFDNKLQPPYALTYYSVNFNQKKKQN